MTEEDKKKQKFAQRQKITFIETQTDIKRQIKNKETQKYIKNTHTKK